MDKILLTIDNVRELEKIAFPDLPSGCVSMTIYSSGDGYFSVEYQGINKVIAIYPDGETHLFYINGEYEEQIKLIYDDLKQYINSLN